MIADCSIYFEIVRPLWITRCGWAMLHRRWQLLVSCNNTLSQQPQERCSTILTPYCELWYENHEFYHEANILHIRRAFYVSSYTYMHSNANLMQLHRYLDFSHSLIAYASFSGWIWSTISLIHSPSTIEESCLPMSFSQIEDWNVTMTLNITYMYNCQFQRSRSFTVLQCTPQSLKDYVSKFKKPMQTSKGSWFPYYSLFLTILWQVHKKSASLVPIFKGLGTSLLLSRGQEFSN